MDPIRFKSIIKLLDPPHFVRDNAKVVTRNGKRTAALALLWQIYSRCVLAQICFRQCGHRCGGGRAMSATMA